MSADSQPAATPKWMVVLGWIISLLPALGLIASSIGNFLMVPDVIKTFEHLGFHEDQVLGVGILKLTCALVFLIPRTAVFGAILCTGYLGGAVATHVPVGDPFVPDILAPLMFGALIWLGLLLRDEHVRAVLPLRSPAGGSSWLVKLLFAFVSIAAVLFFAVFLQPAEYKIERSITINAPAAEIFPHVNDLHKWEAWSPWLKIDPNAKLSYEGPSSGHGAIFRWQGNDEAGEGSMTITDSRPNDLIKIKLEFLKPMQGTADVEFTFKEENQKTVVTWKMAGHNDLAGKAFHAVMNMDKMIGDKHEEGLANLKRVVEAKK